MMDIREELIRICREKIDEKVASLKKSMDGLKEDLENESKSSAGDKYETSREMINIEWNKLSQQLVEFEKQLKTLNRVQHLEPKETVQLGAIVDTGKARYFISVPAGEIYLDHQRYYAIGVHSPIAQAMLGKKKGEFFSFRETSTKINSIA
ncbi:MAG: transcription elongation factor [Gramella sp.]|nr:transcription elongation factor [Christiangramia sp.]